jgi:hypothetical protein
MKKKKALKYPIYSKPKDGRKLHQPKIPTTKWRKKQNKIKTFFSLEKNVR